VYSVIHFDGKSKIYYVKRFAFESIPPGRKTSIINEDPGSRLVLISGAKQPLVKIDQLKGKTLVPETLEVNLAEMIDVKGMKAQGNRLSQHEIKKIELLSDSTFSEDIPDPGATEEETGLEETREEPEEDTGNEDTPQSESIITTDLPGGKKPASATEEISSQGSSQDSANVNADENETPAIQKPVKNIDFEITNPEDLDMDDKGQLGLF